MGRVVRSAGAIVLGLVVVLIFIIAIEWMSSILHPFPPGVDPSDIEACRAHVARYPAWVLLLAVLGWWLCTFVSSWLSTHIGYKKHPAHGILVGAILLTLAVVNMAMLPYPAWFWILNLVGFPACSCAGIMLGCGRRLSHPAME